MRPEAPEAASQFSLRRIVRLFGRAGRLRCPACGGRPIFASWFRMLAGCTVCGLQFDRGESGYEVGGYMVNILAAELLLALLIAGILVVTWPTPPWTVVRVASITVMVAAPVVLYPFAKTLFLALDLLFRPADEEL